MTVTVTIQDVWGKKGASSRIVVKVPASQIEFPYSDEAQRLAQMANAKRYLADAQRAGMKMKVKELEDKT